MRPLVATIDLSALCHNLQQVRHHAPAPRIFAVVKANAYGHGVHAVVEALKQHPDCHGFAVACVEEAIDVRRIAPDARILVLQGGFAADDYQQAARLGLDMVIQSEAQAACLLATPLPHPLPIWLKIDSGMHRLGLTCDEVQRWFHRLHGQPSVASLNLISHFACADEPEHALNQQQRAAFNSLHALPFAYRSFANSAALLTAPETHFDWLRPGIMLYGASPFADRPAAALGLRPAMTLGGQLMGVRDINPGESVGYGASWTATHPTRIATLSCGYADGYPRTAPSGTPVIVDGQRAPLVGRVSMDMLMVDVSHLPHAQTGTPFELWGKQLPVDEVAAACGTLGYELLSKVAARVPRYYPRTTAITDTPSNA